jgi:hypothetical protein
MKKLLRELEKRGYADIKGTNGISIITYENVKGSPGEMRNCSRCRGSLEEVGALLNVFAKRDDGIHYPEYHYHLMCADMKACDRRKSETDKRLDQVESEKEREILEHVRLP